MLCFMNSSPVTAGRAFYAALEGGAHGDALRDLVTDDVRTITHPNLVAPAGTDTTLEEMITNSSRGAGLLSGQRYDIHDVIEVDDLAIFRMTWRGTIAIDAGPFRVGQELVAEIAQFLTARDGRVSRIETFDCYYPIA